MSVITGTAGNDNLIGTSTSDTMSGLDGNDTLDGGSGNDLLIGGLGGDSLIGGLGSDTVSYASAGSGVNLNLATGVNTGGEAAGDAFSGIELFQGTNFNDTFTGSAAVVQLRGGTGDDVYIVSSTNSQVVENASEGTDEIQTSLASYTVPVNVENLTYTGAGNFVATGNASNNVITGAGGNDTLFGGAGADTLNGGAGTDRAAYGSSGVSINLATGVHTGDAAGDVFNSIEIIQGSSTNDTFAGDAGANTFDGGGGNDTITYAGSGSAVSLNLTTGINAGGALGDSLTSFEVFVGSAFNDTFTGSTAVTQLRGGFGGDVYVVSSTNSQVVENAGEGTDEVQTSLASYTLAVNIENLTYTGAGNFLATGNASNNLITGGGGNDTLFGGAGADTLVGGSGTDRAIYGSSGVSINMATGVHTGDAAGDVFNGIEVIQGSSQNDTFAGDAGANNFDGGAGAGDFVTYAGAASGVGVNLLTGANSGEATGDVLTNFEVFIGSAFNDTFTSSAAVEQFRGGTGDDVYVLNSPSDFVTESVGEGTDEVQATSSTYTLSANVENLTYVGAGNFTGIGNTGNNVLTGGGGNDTLTGGAGADTMVGGAGIDEAAYTSSVYINLATGVATGQAVGDVFNGIEILGGSAQNDTLVGDAGANNLDGSAGAFDAVSFESAASGVSVNLSNGIYTGEAAGDTMSGFEVYIGSGFADTFTGGTAAENFIGGPGADVLTGSGNDGVWYLTSSGAVTIDLANQTVSGSDATGDTISGMRGAGGSGFNDSIIGGATLGSTLIGWAGDDTIMGGSGNDVIYPGDHDQDVQGIPATDTNYVDAGAGNDSIYGGTEDTGSEIHAGQGNDFVRAWGGLVYLGDGDDTINVPGANVFVLGEAGADTITFQGTDNWADGGADGDTYILIWGLGTASVSDTGISGTDIVVIQAAADSSDLYHFLDTGTDTMFLGTKTDANDGNGLSSFVEIQNWSTHHIERLQANDGSFVTL